MIDVIVKSLSSARLPMEDEKALQSAIAVRLGSARIVHEREVRVTGGVIDFLIPSAGIGIEVKIKGTAADVLRQLRGYADDERIRRLVLVTSKPFAMPDAIGRRQIGIDVVNLSRGWL